MLMTHQLTFKYSNIYMRIVNHAELLFSKQINKMFLPLQDVQSFLCRKATHHVYQGTPSPNPTRQSCISCETTTITVAIRKYNIVFKIIYKSLCCLNSVISCTCLR